MHPTIFQTVQRLKDSVLKFTTCKSAQQSYSFAQLWGGSLQNGEETIIDAVQNAAYFVLLAEQVLFFPAQFKEDPWARLEKTGWIRDKIYRSWTKNRHSNDLTILGYIRTNACL